MPDNFIRRAQVSIRHLLGGTDVFDGFRTAFEIVLTETDDADLSRISLYNITPERVTDMRPGDRVQVLTGYASSSLDLLHASSVSRVQQVEESGTSNRIDIHVVETSLQTTVINASRSGVYPIQYAVREVFDRAGVPVDYAELDAVVPLSSTVDNWSASGRAVDVLNDLLAPIGAKCKVIAGEGRFYSDGAADPLNRLFNISEASGMIGSPIDIPDGMRVRSVLNNQLEPGITVDVAARHTSGRFKVLKVVHRGDTWSGGDWHSELYCALR